MVLHQSPLLGKDSSPRPYQDRVDRQGKLGQVNNVESRRNCPTIWEVDNIGVIVDFLQNLTQANLLRFPLVIYLPEGNLSLRKCTLPHQITFSKHFRTTSLISSLFILSVGLIDVLYNFSLDSINHRSHVVSNTIAQ